MIVWLCMIRSRLTTLQLGLLNAVRRNGYKIKREHSPIDRVMHTWMLGILYECSAINESNPCDEKALPVLNALIELMLQEACKINDYRVFFPFIMNRINVYVEYLVCGVIPTYGVGLDWNV